MADLIPLMFVGNRQNASLTSDIKIHMIVRILYMILMVITMVISENKDDNNSTTFRVSSAYVGVDDMLDPNARVGVWSINHQTNSLPLKNRRVAMF